MISSLFQEWMERWKGGMPCLSPAAHAFRARTVILMYRQLVGLLLPALVVLASTLAEVYYPS